MTSKGSLVKKDGKYEIHALDDSGDVAFVFRFDEMKIDKSSITIQESIIREALSKYEQGKIEYGEIDLATDKRDFIDEAEKELLDCINYCVFQILKLRKLREND